MKKALSIVLSVTVTVMVWSVIRIIWRSTVQFADIFGDTGGEGMALIIGWFWIGLPLLSFIRLIPSAEFPNSTWAAVMLLSLPFFALTLVILPMPIHELATCSQEQQFYLSQVWPLQMLLWATTVLPWSPVISWLSRQPSLCQAPA